MSTTTPRGYPKPALEDQPNGPAQMAALADAIDADVTDALNGISHQIGRTSTASIPAGGSGASIGTGWGDVYNVTNTRGAIVYNAGQLIAPLKGVYEVSYTLRWDTSPAQNFIRETYLLVNGVSVLHGRRSQINPSTITSSLNYMGASAPVKLNAGDTVQLGAFQSSTVAILILEGVFTLSLAAPLP